MLRPFLCVAWVDFPVGDEHAVLTWYFFSTYVFQCNDFEFLNGGSELVTAGESLDQLNVCVWDTISEADGTSVRNFKCHEGGGATSLCYIRASHLLVTGHAPSQLLCLCGTCAQLIPNTSLLSATHGMTIQAAQRA